MAYWNESLPVWKLHGLVTLAALLVFSFLPRTLLARAVFRSAVLVVGGVALAANVGAVAYSAARLSMVGPWPIVLEVAIGLLLAFMILEALATRPTGVAV
jgi:hypothetical protein